jgi:hypothetical protein
MDPVCLVDPENHIQMDLMDPADLVVQEAEKKQVHLEY